MWIGQQEAREVDSNAVPLYLDIHGHIAETNGSNFVIFRDGQVISPRRNNILWGISLTVLQELLTEMSVPFVEQDLQTYDVINADEAWIPTTPYCLGPVVRINGVPIGDGKPGPMWRRVLDHCGRSAWPRRMKGRRSRRPARKRCHCLTPAGFVVQIPEGLTLPSGYGLRRYSPTNSGEDPDLERLRQRYAEDAEG